MGEDVMTNVDIEAGPVVLSNENPPIYRYTLHRRWDENYGVVNFMMLNPSTADGNRLDPTLRRCRDFAKSWGYGGFVITNLFAYRARSPVVMKTVTDPVGPDNDSHIIEQAKQAEIVVCGWGVHGSHRNRDKIVLNMLSANGIKLHYLTLTKAKHPGHPLFLSSELRPIEWVVV
jgi:hypothetical protein